MRMDDFRREYLAKGFRHDLNVIKVPDNVSIPHKLGMIDVCRKLVQKGIPFMTEVRLIGGGRADIVSPLTNEIFEVMVSETDSRCDAKIYGKDFTIVKVKV